MADFGFECRERLWFSDTKASISLPVAKLVEAFGVHWKLSLCRHPECPRSLEERGVVGRCAETYPLVDAGTGSCHAMNR
ncbi:hypothetical protein [Streptomyces olivaceiscleroticus]|uniref:Uncharacterized protein n=1 Tax=Streptomyces olivaceiscleroticus TaxID=68245 RepID=A0ABP3L7D2_9ACTN